MTPYHTGKVQIGRYYRPIQRPEIDSNSTRLQSALVPTSRRIIEAERAELRASLIDALFWLCAAVAISVIILAPHWWPLLTN